MISSIFANGLKDHSFTCILSHVVERDPPPMVPFERTPQCGSPNHRVLVERPRFPQAGFLPFWACRRRDDSCAGVMSASMSGSGRSVLRPRPHAAGRRIRRGVLGRDEGRGARQRSMPGEAMLFRVFNTIGETLPSMALARQAVALAKGKSRAAVQAAAETVAEQLVEHGATAGRAAVRRAPRRRSARRHGHDHSLRHRQAARRSVGARRCGRHSLPDQRRRHLPRIPRRSVRVECRQARRRSPVGGRPRHRSRRPATPTATASTTRRCWLPSAFRSSSTPIRAWPSWPRHGGGRPSTCRRRAPRRPAWSAKIPVVNMDIQRLALSFTHPALFPYAKFDIDGIENIPATGPAIIVGNHRSYFDPMAMGVAIARTDRTVRFLGKKEVFDAPVIGQIAAAMGGIRVDRGHRQRRAVEGRGRSAGARRHGRDHAAGHDPAWARRSSTRS